MPRNASGNYTLPATYNPVVSGTAILAAWANTTLPDIGQGLTDSLDRSGRGGMLAAFKATDGSAAAPGIAFNNETTSGLSRLGAGILALSILGTEVTRWTAGGQSFSQPLLAPVGSAATPAFSFSGDPNTGMYWGGSDTIAWGVNAGLRMTLDGSSLTLRGGSAQALRIHDNDGFIGFWEATGTTRRLALQVSGTAIDINGETALPFRLYTNATKRLHILSTGFYGFNSEPVSSVAARFQDPTAFDVGLELQRTSATNFTVLSYDRTATAYRTLTFDGSTIQIGTSGVVRYSFGANSLSPAATNTYNLGGTGAEWQNIYARNLFRDSAGDLIIASTDAAGRIDLRTAGASALLLEASGKAVFGGGALTTTDSQAFTATPTFSANASNVHEFSGAMTANVTSCTISGPSNGQTIQIRVKQDGTGGRTFASPSGAKITGSIGLTANQASILTLTYSAMDSRWEGSWLQLPV